MGSRQKRNYEKRLEFLQKVFDKTRKENEIVEFLLGDNKILDVLYKRMFEEILLSAKKDKPNMQTFYYEAHKLLRDEPKIFFDMVKEFVKSIKDIK